MMNLTFKRHYPLLVWLALAAIGLILGLGDQRIVAYAAQGDAPIQIAQLLTTLGIH